MGLEEKSLISGPRTIQPEQEEDAGNLAFEETGRHSALMFHLSLAKISGAFILLLLSYGQWDQNSWNTGKSGTKTKHQQVDIKFLFDHSEGQCHALPGLLEACRVSGG